MPISSLLQKNLFTTIALMPLFLVFNSPAHAHHETLPTHTPTPIIEISPSATLSATPTAFVTSGPSIPDLNDKTTLLMLLALIAVGGFIVFVTRPK